MNVGEKSFVDAVYIYDGKGCYWVKRQDYDASYRRTSFHDYYCIILAIRLNLSASDPTVVKGNIIRYINERKEKQPILKSTFGSVFKNPLPKKAGQLVDSLDLKGTCIGDAQVSMHANFENMTTYDDTVSLIKLIQIRFILCTILN